MYTAEDIKWVKSVTRDGGADWAYTEYGVSDVFDLHFPNNKKWYPKNYKKPQPGELIVIFQTLLPHGNHPGGPCVTHLVTPTNHDVYNDHSPVRPYFRPVTVVGKANPAYIVPREWKFFKPNRGQICGINKIERRSGVDYSLAQKKQYLWEIFNEVDPNIDTTIHNLSIINDLEDYEAEEGAEREKMKLHRYKERDKEIVSRAKERARIENRLHCEVCQFNFSERYPMLGAGFIECHHKIPISTGGVRITRIDDLAMVCANCHRMLHKKHNGRYLSVEELQQMIHL